MTYKGFNIIPISDFNTVNVVDVYLVYTRSGFLVFHSRDLDLCKLWIDEFNKTNTWVSRMKELVKEGK